MKRRSDNFADPSGKGKGKVLASVFKAAREGTELTHVRREDGTLACSEQDVSSVLYEFFTRWFASEVSVEARWGSWDKMMQVDTSEVAPQFKEFVETCYRKPYSDNTARATEEKWWDDTLRPLEMAELKDALKASKSGAAPGQSQVSVDILKLLDADGLRELLAFFNACLGELRVPDSINRALLRLLPKTDKGLKDLAATRPIALMET